MGQLSQNSMDPVRIAFIKAGWHSDIVDKCYCACMEQVSRSNILHNIDTYDVPGALEIPLLAKDLAKTGRYDAIIASAFIVNGGIYRHDFVAQAVVSGLMQAGMDSGVPVLSVSLTPHQYQETAHHNAIYRAHFVQKGREAAEAALAVSRVRDSLAA